MNLDELKKVKSPEELETDYLKAIWYDLNDDWDTAHKIVQRLNTVSAKWIHAYLHREEGDIPNCKFWYSSADKEYPGNLTMQDEVEIILNELTKN